MGKQEYIQANKDWLEAKAKEEGVKALPKGIYYKVINEGKNDGKHPTPRSIVTAHYTGWTINGKKFDSSRGGTPVAFRLNELIEGGLLRCNRCASETSGKSTFLPNWGMANSRSLASPVAQRSSLRLNCSE